MLEINPVLAGKFEGASYVPASNNINQAAQTAAQTEDASTGFKVPKTTDAGEIKDFSFGDFLDIINPLQHIPLVSSIYRAATGEPIKPFTRVAGDILYGAGLIGGLSGGVSAIADAMMESQTGKDVGGTIVASLFGSDETKQTTQLAQAQANQNDAVAPASESGNSKVAQTDPIKQAIDDAAKAQIAALTGTPLMPTASQAVSQTAQNQNPATTPVATTPISPKPITLAASKAYPLNRTKQPFGGVIDLNGTRGGQELATTLAADGNNANVARIGNTIYTGSFPRHIPPQAASAAPAAPVAATPPDPETAQTASAAIPGAISSDIASVSQDASKTGPRKNPLPPELVNDMMLQALSKYKNTALGPTSSGGSVLDITN